jgi:hypothetical protein
MPFRLCVDLVPLTSSQQQWHLPALHKRFVGFWRRTGSRVIEFSEHAGNRRAEVFAVAKTSRSSLPWASAPPGLTRRHGCPSVHDVMGVRPPQDLNEKLPCKACIRISKTESPDSPRARQDGSGHRTR